MSVNNIHTRLEKLIDSLSIKEGREKYLKNQINYLKKQLRRVSRSKFKNPQSTIEKISNSLEVLTFWYGGSFDRGVYIDKGFDIDIYPIYKVITKNKNNYNINQKSLSGEILFSIIYEDLSTIHSEINPNLLILEEPSYTHAIPIQLDFEDQTIYVDCIPAIELPHGYLIAPNGLDSVKKVNLKLEEEGLSKVNKKHSGRVTKLIRLLKYWNWNWDYPLKSYVIQRLVEEIFLEERMNSWDKAVKTFFSRSINIFNKHFNNKIVLRDRVYTHKSILEDYSEYKINSFYEALQEGQIYAVRNDWTKLFGAI